MALSDDQIERYSRQIILRELGGVGQERLLHARCLVLGVGAARDMALSYLAGAGVGSIDVVDLGEEEVARSALPLPARDELNPDASLRWLERGDVTAPSDYDLVLDLDGSTVSGEGSGEDSGEAAAESASALPAGTPHKGWIGLRRERDGALVLLVVPAGAGLCLACARPDAAATEPRDEPACGDTAYGRGSGEPGDLEVIDLALAGSFAALAACRALASIASDVAPRSFRLAPGSATWTEGGAHRLEPCPRGCPRSAESLPDSG